MSLEVPLVSQMIRIDSLKEFWLLDSLFFESEIHQTSIGQYSSQFEKHPELDASLYAVYDLNNTYGTSFKRQRGTVWKALQVNKPVAMK
jgi:hypothetical protein